MLMQVRLLPQAFVILLLAVCAYTFMHSSDFTDQAAQVDSTLSTIPSEAIRRQAIMAVTLRHLLPVGLNGAFCAVMLAAFISNYDTYMHSWGTIFIQDVVLPIRKKPLAVAQHIRLLKWSIFGVAAFTFCFSMLFQELEYIVMFLFISGSIFVGGAGCALIGGLYWKRGTAAGAWAGMITGMCLSSGAIILKQIHASVPFSNKLLVAVVSHNQLELAFAASLCAIVIYVVVSLFGNKVFDMEKLLHRGPYAVMADKIDVDTNVGPFRRMIGMGSDFTTWKDKVIYLGVIAFIFLYVMVFVVVTVYNIMVDVRTQWWLDFVIYCRVIFVLSSLFSVWLIVGLVDLNKLPTDYEVIIDVG